MSPRNKVLLIGAICLAPIVLGTLAYVFRWDVGAPGNYGELLPPKPLAGAPFERLRGKWLLVVVDDPACDAWCEKKLYYLRQLRRAQGKDMDRIDRLWLLTRDGLPRAGLAEAFQGTLVAPAPKLDAFPGKPADHIYLVDPLGNLMMRWPRDPDASRVLKDLQRLMRIAPRAA